MHPLQQRAREIHDRLVNPPNAVREPKPVPRLLVLPPKAKKWEPPYAMGATITEIKVVYVVRPNRIPLDLILRVVARRFNVSTEDIKSDRRTGHLIRPRHVVCHLSKTMTSNSLPAIGRAIGGRDHTTVLHAVRKVKGQREADSNFDDQLKSIEAEIRGLVKPYPVSVASERINLGDTLCTPTHSTSI